MHLRNSARLKAGSTANPQASNAATNSTATKTRSKFAKRFNMTGSGMTQADEQGRAAASSDRKFKDG